MSNLHLRRTLFSFPKDKEETGEKRAKLQTLKQVQHEL